MAEQEGFYSQTNSNISITTIESENLLSQATQIAVPVTNKEDKGTTQLLTTASRRLEEKKSVYFLTTSTSTTTLPLEPIRRLRPELNTLLSVLIKQTRSAIKAEHHIELLQQAITTRNPPRGLRPREWPELQVVKYTEITRICP